MITCITRLWCLFKLPRIVWVIILFFVFFIIYLQESQCVNLKNCKFPDLFLWSYSFYHGTKYTIKAFFQGLLLLAKWSENQNFALKKNFGFFGQIFFKSTKKDPKIHVSVPNLHSSRNFRQFWLCIIFLYYFNSFLIILQPNCVILFFLKKNIFFREKN